MDLPGYRVRSATRLPMSLAQAATYAAYAKGWEALPLGNGRLGAMVFGEPVQECLQLNEETVYAGTIYVSTAKPTDRRVAEFARADGSSSGGTPSLIIETSGTQGIIILR